MNEGELLKLFRDIHAHPELGYNEYRTTQRIREILQAANVRILESELETGLIAEIEGQKQGRIIGLRCDLDVLPLQEESGLPYASVIPGAMHACGHDFHAATMVGAAWMLKQRETELAGRVKIIFQPAEEVGGGVRMVLASGLLEDVDEFYGIHSYPQFESGTLGIREGAVMAAPDRFRIIIHGRGSHAATPSKGTDPIPAAASIVMAAQTIISRRTNPFSSAVVSVTHVEAGRTWNVMPETALLEGTVRTLDARDRSDIRAALKQIALSTADAFGCSADFVWQEGAPAVVNDAELCSFARELAHSMGFNVARQEDTMGGEDFSEYIQRRPGVFIRVGTGGGRPSHHPGFTVDPSALWPAARYFAELALARGRIIR